jgi:hypothetical protein
MTSDTQILMQYAKPDAEPQPDTCGLTPGTTAPFTLDCGVNVLGLETGGDNTVYYFLLKARRDDWYQIVVSPQSGAITWIKDPHTAGLSMSAYRLLDWLQSQDSYQTAHEITDDVRAVPVRKAPADAAEDLTDCAGYEDGDGLIPAEDKAVKGDWVHVTCLENDCNAPNDPQRACIRVENLQKVACVQGWARWRTNDRHLRLYPHNALAQGC